MWEWYANAAGDVSFFCLLLLAFLGVTVSFVRNLINRAPEKWGLAITFVVLAAIAWHANRTDREESEARITGSKNFAYFLLRDGQKVNGKFLLSLHGVGYTPSALIELYDISGGKKEIVGRLQGRIDIQDETVNAEPREQGKWEFDFRSRYSNWDQVLVIKEENGAVTETIEVRRRGQRQCVFCQTRTLTIKELPNVSR